MKLSTYIRNEQKFQIFIRGKSGEWEKYDPTIHGPAESIASGYVVAYPNGEVLENRLNSDDLPPNIYYISVVPYKLVKMPKCAVEDPRVKIVHEPSAYHQHGLYCTKLTNIGDIPFRVNKFSFFSKKGIFLGYYLSTISNDWFSHEQFTYWYNTKLEWISPGSTVADHDNYGFGNGYWVFEIEFENKKVIFVKSRSPKKDFNKTS